MEADLEAPESEVVTPRSRSRGLAPRSSGKRPYAADFPRSRVMQMLADPRQRRLLILGFTLLAMVVSRRQRLLRGGLLFGTLREFAHTLRSRP